MEGDTYSVDEISRVIRDQLALTFPSELWVRGEIQNLNRHSSGHVYFQLAASGTDDVLAVTLFAKARKQVNARLKQAAGVRMSDGTEVRIRARVEWFAKQGRPQLRMSDIDPEFTLGRLELDRERLLAKLFTEGLLEANGALPVPAAPKRVGLVTSAGSAAHADFIAELEAAGQHWEVLLVSTAVQGPGAEHEVADAIRAAEAAGVELIAVIRGGGARTDLATFDKEVVARTVAACTVPVFVGIGHEIDRTVVEEVAAQAFKTPTACAAALGRIVSDHLDGTEEVWARCVASARRIVERSDQRLRSLATALDQRTRGAVTRCDTSLALATERLHRSSRRTTERSGHRLDEITRSVDRACAAVIERADTRLATAQRLVAANDPVRTMRRGWSYTVGPDGTVVRDPRDLRPGDVITTRVERGRLLSSVTTVEPDEPLAAGPADRPEPSDPEMDRSP